MKKSELNPRYNNEILAWEYDQRQPDPFPGELEWYLTYARLSSGPILELACGSGRLLIPIAQGGFVIDGVDNSKAMLSRLRGKLEHLDAPIKSRIRTFCHDMAEFQTYRKYGMAMIAYNSLQYLGTRERILECFRKIYQCLRQEGYFLLLIRKIDLTSFTDNETTVYDWLDHPIINEELGVSVGSKMVSFLESDNNRIIDERTYVIEKKDGSSETLNFRAIKPIIDTSKYIDMLDQTGFDVKVSYGYNESSDDAVAKEICIVCTKL